jgi:hypothetical protein
MSPRFIGIYGPTIPQPHRFHLHAHFVFNFCKCFCHEFIAAGGDTHHRDLGPGAFFSLVGVLLLLMGRVSIVIFRKGSLRRDHVMREITERAQVKHTEAFTVQTLTAVSP